MVSLRITAVWFPTRPTHILLDCDVRVHIIYFIYYIYLHINKINIDVIYNK